MLAATVEATADLDVKILNGRSELGTFPGQSLAKLPGESTRGGDPEFARIGTRAGDDIDDGPRSRFAEAHGRRALHKARIDRSG